jgi:hypothetical protein
MKRALNSAVQLLTVPFCLISSGQRSRRRYSTPLVANTLVLFVLPPNFGQEDHFTLDFGTQEERESM